MTEPATSRVAASPALIGVITFAVLLETTLVHVVLHRSHPIVAWVITVSTLSLIPVIWSRLSKRR